MFHAIYCEHVSQSNETGKFFCLLLSIFLFSMIYVNLTAIGYIHCTVVKFAWGCQLREHCFSAPNWSHHGAEATVCVSNHTLGFKTSLKLLCVHHKDRQNLKDSLFYSTLIQKHVVCGRRILYNIVENFLKHCVCIGTYVMIWRSSCFFTVDSQDYDARCAKFLGVFKKVFSRFVAK